MRKIAMVAVLALVAGSAQAGSLGLPNLVGNPGFETGSLPPWNNTGWGGVNDYGYFGVPAPSWGGGQKWFGIVSSWGGSWDGPVNLLRQVVDVSQSPGWNPSYPQLEVDLQFDRLLKAVSGDTWRDVGIRVWLDWMEDGSYPYPGDPGYTRQMVYEESMPAGNDYPSSNDWVHKEIRLTLPSQPQFLSIEVEMIVHYAMWSFVGVDNVDLEARCIPEPATMGLLLLGLPLVRRRR